MNSEIRQSLDDRVKAILAVDLGKYIAHATDHSSEVPILVPASRAELALKQFYCGKFIRADQRCAVSQQLDPFWHSHILHTHDYYRFCEEVTDGFIHHNPLDPTDGIEVTRMADLYVETRRDLMNYFGDAFVAEAFPPLEEINIADIVVCDWDPPRKSH